MTEPFEQVRGEVSAAMERLGVPGVALGVLHGGSTETAGFGVTSVENPLEIDARTIFRIASISKTFTATAVMRLVEQGKLDLDVPLRTHLPELRMAGDGVAEQVTLRHCLNHHGGWVGDIFDDFGAGDDALARYVAHLAEIEQLTPLGEVYSYNNAGFAFAGRAIEIAADRTFEDAMHELVLAPLGLERTFYFADNVITHRFAVGHVVLPEGPVVSRPQKVTRALHAAAGLFSCVEDLFTWARFHLGDGTAPDGRRLLRPETLHYMQSPLVLAGSPVESVGITWQVGTTAGHRTVGHGGQWSCQLSNFRIVPESDFAVIVLTNAHNGAELHGRIVGTAIRAFLGGEDPKPSIRTLPIEQLQPYAGHYQAKLTELDLTVEDGGLILTQRRRENAINSTPAAPNPAPVRLAFIDADRVIALDPPFEGARGEFIRDPREQIAWLRWSRRIHRRLY